MELDYLLVFQTPGRLDGACLSASVEAMRSAPTDALGICTGLKVEGMGSDTAPVLVGFRGRHFKVRR